MSDVPPPAPPVAVGLLSPSPDQVHDGFTLVSYLNARAGGCGLRRFWIGTPRALATSELVQAGSDLALLSAGEENLTEVLSLARLLGRRRRVLLFGREMADGDLRGAALDDGVEGVLVGDPRPVVRDLLRALARAPDQELPARLPGLARPGGALVPREPPRHLDAFPPGDYSYEPEQVALGIPLRQSCGFPFPATPMAERVWEAPLRGVSPERTLEVMRHHVEEHGARQFLMTDLAANAAGDDLLRLAGGIVEAGLELFWYADIWADPALDRGALNLLRRSGCRGLRLLLWTGSAALSRRLGLGVVPDVALRICQDAAAEGLPISAVVKVGAPGEEEEDRRRTQAWLAMAADHLWAVDRLEGWAIRDGAPLRGDEGLAFPAELPHRQWHDGGENNESKRRVWVREARTVCGAAGLRHPGQADRQFAAMVEPSLRRRLQSAVSSELAGSPAWRRERLAMAGVLHGREAFGGPESLHIDLAEMEGEAALGLVDQAAELGVGRIVFGRHGAGEGRDATDHPRLEELLGRCRERRTPAILRSSLQGLQPDRLERLAGLLATVQVECRGEAGLADLEEPVATLAEARARRRELLPRLELTAWIGPSLPSPVAVAEAADRMGADRLLLRAVRDAEDLLDEQARGVALGDAQALQEMALERDQTKDRLLLKRAGAGWPDGFGLQGSRGRLTCTCPTGKAAAAMEPQPAYPGLRLARFSEDICQRCPRLAECPVSRLDYRVPLRPLEVRGVADLAEDLSHPDMGFGLAGRTTERRPCLAGWDSARVSAAGDLFVCPTCGVEPVGNVLADSLAGVWYSRGLNEFRRMSVGASLVLPYVDRNLCAMGCGRRGQDLGLVDCLRALGKEQMAALEGVGAGDRLGV